MKEGNEASFLPLITIMVPMITATFLPSFSPVIRVTSIILINHISDTTDVDNNDNPSLIPSFLPAFCLSIMIILMIRGIIIWIIVITI